MNKTVVIGQPVHDSGIPGPAMLAQNQLLAWGLKMGVILNVFQQYNNWLEDARNKCVRLALDSKATHLLFLDSDIVPPPNLIVELFKMNVPIASGLYYLRIPPYLPVMFNVGELKKDGTNLHPILDYKPNTVIDADHVGMGCCMIECSLLFEMFKQFDGDGRWFAFEPGKGEDIWFCNRAKKMGVTPRVHTGIMCGHVANHIVVEDHFKRAQKHAKDPLLNDASYPYMRSMGAIKECQML